ncbi:FecR family protein [Maribellus luteus]|uniref:FecR family protein n=1 Tax=Maribellus luteus TaxID=2305463 RepID=A0A399SWU0_9BACT|nr:FecR family protein [Maribellus luteus]RIJ48550.1 FecR family protein [Maribellus luteus]
MIDTSKNKVLKRYLKGNYSVNDHLLMKKWFTDNSEYKEIEPLLDDSWETYGRQESEQPEQHVFNKIISQIWLQEENKKSRNNLRNIFIRVAAALIIGLVTGYFVSNLRQASYEPVYFTAHAPKGSISETLLPDGSLVVLNAGSRLEYALGKNNQVNEVRLDGEAWFDIHPNPERKFIVKTSHYNVNVTGTQFNVKAYEEDDEITTTLEKGSVSIESGEKTALAYSPELKPGEQFSLNKETQKAILSKVNTKIYTTWKDNKLIFINMDLDELFVLLERKFGVDIEISNTEILDLHYTGTIKNETILEILDLISHTLPLNYEIIGQKIIITKIK